MEGRIALIKALIGQLNWELDALLVEEELGTLSQEMKQIGPDETMKVKIAKFEAKIKQMEANANINYPFLKKEPFKKALKSLEDLQKPKKMVHRAKKVVRSEDRIKLVWYGHELSISPRPGPPHRLNRHRQFQNRRFLDDIKF